MTPDAAFMAYLVFAAIVVLLILLICWVVLPFAVLGTKPILRQILAEQQRTNELLRTANPTRSKPPAS